MIILIRREIKRKIKADSLTSIDFAKFKEEGGEAPKRNEDEVEISWPPQIRRGLKTFIIEFYQFFE